MAPENLVTVLAVITVLSPILPALFQYLKERRAQDQADEERADAETVKVIAVLREDYNRVRDEREAARARADGLATQISGISQALADCQAALSSALAKMDLLREDLASVRLERDEAVKKLADSVAALAKANQLLAECQRLAVVPSGKINGQK